MSYNLEQPIGVTQAFNSGALAIGSTTSQFSTGAIVNYAVYGRFYSKAATPTQALVIEPNTGLDPRNANSFQSIPAGSAGAFLVLLDAAGNFTVAQGAFVDAGKAAPVPPPVSGKSVVGVIKVSNASAAPFVPGTTAFNAASITTTYINCATHPGSSV